MSDISDISDISDNEIFGDDNYDNQSIESFIIDMDDIYENTTENISENTISKISLPNPKLILESKSQLQSQAKPKIQLINKKQILKKKEIIETSDKIVTTKKIKIPKDELFKAEKPKDEPSKSETPKSEILKPKTTKKSEEIFEFNEETINLFTKDLDVKKILIKHPPNSPYLEKFNDTIIICLLIKYGHFKDYHCTTSKCKVGKLWNGKPIQLILNRINNNQFDLSITNLELICANCFMVTYGLDIFIKKKKEAILLCSICEFPLVKFKDNRKKKGICLSCEYKIKQISENKQEDNYYNKLKETYSNNPILSDDIKPINSIASITSITSITSYNSQNSKYNSFENKSKSNMQNSIMQNSIIQKPIIQKPIIELNMSLPNLSDLINDDDNGDEDDNDDDDNGDEDE